MIPLSAADVRLIILIVNQQICVAGKSWKFVACEHSDIILSLKNDGVLL